MTEILSPNMLKTFEQCAEKYYFKYIKKISMPTDNEIFIKGQNIHALASYYLRKQNIDNMEDSLNNEEKNLWNFLKSNKYFSYEAVDTEYNLAFKINNHFFGGRIDAIVKNGNNYYILDYKTGSAPKNAKYDFQTIVYLMAVRSFYKTDNITFVYLDLKNKTEINIELSSELVREYEQKLVEIAAKIDNANFKPTNNDCKNCEYGIICYDKKLSN